MCQFSKVHWKSRPAHLSAAQTYSHSTLWLASLATVQDADAGTSGKTICVPFQQNDSHVKLITCIGDDRLGKLVQTQCHARLLAQVELDQGLSVLTASHACLAKPCSQALCQDMRHRELACLLSDASESAISMLPNFFFMVTLIRSPMLPIDRQLPPSRR